MMMTIGIHICHSENTISSRVSFPDSLYLMAMKLYWYCPIWHIKRRFQTRVNHACYWRTMPLTHFSGWIGSRLHALAIEASDGSGALQSRYNGRDGVPNHQPHYCLLNCLFWRRSQKKLKPRFRQDGAISSNSLQVTLEMWRHHFFIQSSFEYHST